MANYQQPVSLDDVPDHQLRDVLRGLLDLLCLQIIREQTPDYTSYFIRRDPGSAS